MSDMFTKKQVAKLIGVSERTVTRHDVEWGLNPVRVTDRLVQYHPAEVQAYLARIGKKQDILTLTEAEQIIRSALESQQFDDETARNLQRVADLLASMKM